MPKQLPIWDQRMFIFMDHCIAGKIKGISSREDFVPILKLSSRTTLLQVVYGKQSFRHAHFKAACDKFGVSMDWFFGYTDRMTRMDVKLNPVEMLKEATRLIEGELKNKVPLTKPLTKGHKKTK